VNPLRANEIRDRIQQTPQDIRMRCPRGHFIADVWLEVPDGQDTIAMWPRGRPQQPYEPVRNLTGWYGFWMSLSRSNVRHRGQQPSGLQDASRWTCQNARCRYSATISCTSLALELAAAALAGQREYRLTA